MALSDDAKAVAGAWFGWMTAASEGLTFLMRETRPAERSQRALDELLAAGVIERVEVYGPPAVTYRPRKACRQYLAWLRKNEGRADINWRLVEQIETGHARKEEEDG